MARYIDADALREYWLENGVNENVYNTNDVLNSIDYQPTADVAEVKHGEWLHLCGDEWCCTNCGEVITTEGSWEKPTKKYCPRCGAKMDGGKEDV